MQYKLHLIYHTIRYLFCSFIRLGPAKVTYEILPHENKMSHIPVVTVDEEGNLVASSKTGSAILLVTAVEEFGVVQQLSVIVKVTMQNFMCMHF